MLAVRIGWFALPLTVGPALVHGLQDASAPVKVVASILAWLAWGVVAVAVLVPRTVSLTALRVGAPAALAASIWATARSGDIGVAELVAIGWTALLAAVVLFVPIVTDLFVDGSSYGPEKRMALRTPTALFLGPVELAWVIVVCGVAAGPLLLAARAWVAGAFALVAGAAFVHPALRSLHQLSRRWVVFVRVGFVLHDPMSLADPVLFLRQDVQSLGPAPADAEHVAMDLSGRALGLALELRLRTKATLGLVERRHQSRNVDTNRMLFTPARPGALLSEAGERGIPRR